MLRPAQRVPLAVPVVAQQALVQQAQARALQAQLVPLALRALAQVLQPPVQAPRQVVRLLQVRQSLV